MKYLYVVLLAGLPVAAFDTPELAERYRVRLLVNCAYGESAILHTLSYRNCPDTSIIRVSFSEHWQGFSFDESVVVQRFSRNALAQASLNINEDLPE